MSASTKQNLLAFIIATVAFLFCFFILKWPLWLAVLLVIGLFMAVYLLASPVFRIGNVELESLKNGQEIKAIFDHSQVVLQGMKSQAALIEDQTIKQQASQLSEATQSILNYLEENPKEISRSRHFLDYYLNTGHQIISNFREMEEAKLTPSRFEEIKNRTHESMELLNDIYANQRDGYHLDRIRSLEVETELLEKTLKLGGGYHHEE